MTRSGATDRRDRPEWQARSVRSKTNDALVDALVRGGSLVSDAVRAAFDAVDRAAFVPPALRNEAYRDRPVLLKLDDAGRAVSTVSQPTMVALMLEELAVRRGDRILEVGTASGYNAALLSHLAGPHGLVITIELDEELSTRAAERLAGYSNVRVLVGDGREGHPAEGPYDGIIVTAGAAAVEPAWTDQLRVRGRLVVPITGADGHGRCVTYERAEAGLLELESMPCGFVPLR
jgi:protein-L-isoaspartate(D-aspartate) O-methyltransferase